MIPAIPSCAGRFCHAMHTGSDRFPFQAQIPILRRRARGGVGPSRSAVRRAGRDSRRAGARACSRIRSLTGASAGRCPVVAACRAARGRTGMGAAGQRLRTGPPRGGSRRRAGHGGARRSLGPGLVRRARGGAWGDGDRGGRDRRSASADHVRAGARAGREGRDGDGRTSSGGRGGGALPLRVGLSALGTAAR